MKKFLKSFTIVFLCTFLCFSLISCKKSAEEKLNEKEQELFYLLLEGTKNFYNPEEVRIINVYYAMLDEDVPTHYYLTLKGNNKVGGTITKKYVIYAEDWIVAGFLIKSKGVLYDDDSNYDW